MSSFLHFFNLICSFCSLFLVRRTRTNNNTPASARFIMPPQTSLRSSGNSTPPSSPVVEEVRYSTKRKDVSPTSNIFITPSKKQHMAVNPFAINSVADVFKFVASQLDGKPIEFNEGLLKRAISNPCYTVAVEMIEYTYKHLHDVTNKWKDKLTQSSDADIKQEDRKRAVQVIDDVLISADNELKKTLEHLQSLTSQRPQRASAASAKEKIEKIITHEINHIHKKKSSDREEYIPSASSQEDSSESDSSEPDSEHESDVKNNIHNNTMENEEGNGSEEKEIEVCDNNDEEKEAVVIKPTKSVNEDDELSFIKQALLSAAKCISQDLENEETNVWNEISESTMINLSTFQSLYDRTFASLGTNSRIKTMLKHCVIAQLIHRATNADEEDKRSILDWLSKERKIDGSLRSKYERLYEMINKRYASKLQDMKQMTRLPFIRADVTWTQWRKWMTDDKVKKLQNMMKDCDNPDI